MAWAARVVLEPELFPTRLRATGVGAVRAAAYALYTASIFFTQAFSEFSYLVYNVGLWALGLSGAALWLARGMDTARRPLRPYQIYRSPRGSASPCPAGPRLWPSCHRPSGSR
ncbi:hypothetical protein [Acidilobus sp.]|uniref:hypothetical protein n=1 Tax=Acidilobus sp. TaxID=1872109 RepID=UPI003D08AAFA